MDEESLSAQLVGDDPELLTGSLSEHNRAERPEKGLKLYRWHVHRIVDNLYLRLFGLLLVIIDVILVLVRLDQTNWKLNSDKELPAYEAISTCIVIYFMIELLARIFAIGISHYFSKPFEVFDALIVTLSFVFEFTFEIGRIIILARLVRIVLILRFVSEQHKIKKAARLMVSQNKRRYRQDGFDLDLTYVTDRIIAMSFPSSGKTAIYRNPIGEVARFFNTKYPGHYKIVNCCSEKDYDHSYFENQVVRCPIDDHNVPPLGLLFQYCKDFEAYMAEDPSNVLAVHCKGGKGRTGTMICAYMLWSGRFATAEEALDYFADRRTDKAVGSMFQGVQTPSQYRYVGYVEDILRHHNRTPPAPVELTITTIRVCSLRLDPSAENGIRSLTVTVYNGDICVYNSEQLHMAPVPARTSAGQDCLEYSGLSLPVTGDVKTMFHSLDLPKDYDKCAFYFWFHTNYVQDNHLRIERKDLDNPHKPKRWNIYDENFAVELEFGASTTA